MCWQIQRPLPRHSPKRVFLGGANARPLPLNAPLGVAINSSLNASKRLIDIFFGFSTAGELSKNDVESPWKCVNKHFLDPTFSEKPGFLFKKMQTKGAGRRRKGAFGLHIFLFALTSSAESTYIFCSNPPPACLVQVGRYDNLCFLAEKR